jgi:hypothetical protein
MSPSSYRRGQALPPVLHTIELGGVQALPARIVRHSHLPDGGIRYTVVSIT